MMPGMDPRMMKQAMKRMGIKQEDIDATEVIIKCADKEIIISPVSVQKVHMMGQDSFQVSGEITERELSTEPEVREEDIETVIEQTGATREKAIDAIEANDGDLAKAIMHLQNDDSD